MKLVCDKDKSEYTNKIRIAHITKVFTANGITSVVLNYTSHLDKEKFVSTIISGSPITSKLKEKSIENGVEFIEVPSKIKSSRGYYLGIWNALKNGKYDIVHVHGNSATMTIELLMAFVLGIRVRVVHCHNSKCEYLKAHKVLLPLFMRLYTRGYACSRLAGNWLFGSHPFEVLVNGFETKKYLFNENKRVELREKLGLSDKFVIGNVAGFTNQKNHEFLLDVFESVADKDKKAVLFLVGDGPLLDTVLERIENSAFRERIVYYGVSNNVEDLYNVMDLFVLPSKFEGLGLVFLEAQINGLKCIASDQVPVEVNLNNQTKFLSLVDPLENWAKEILSISVYDREKMSGDSYNKSAEYDIDKCVKKLEKDYLSLINKSKIFRLGFI